ncbi:V/A-type H+-transporting ATPase subunit I [Caloramator quimbayensis]|uniref:V/A-type H+-transporting ATPase subunit I n=1 Tax=Caloramator quimbayensis TaxID=1147123 RepID=A0A1T4XMM0_9CLOT|nr:V-type ATP synthase subunit I [Caloramator quimbayensis]SKA90772.1 V/A-type H+-transporting ATPase subunit I [Caloramator quimbayensis]
MAIVKMKKITVAAPQSQRDNILDALQSKGCVELIDLKNLQQEAEGIGYFKENKSISQTEINYNKIKFCYDFLKQHESKKEGLFSKKTVISKEEFDKLEETINWENIYLECKKIDDDINHIKNKKNKLITQIEQYSNWIGLDVCSKELNILKNVSYFIGTISKKYESKIIDELSSNFKDIYIEKISEKQQDVNVFMLCHKNDSVNVSEVLKKYGFTKINFELSMIPKEQIKSFNDELSELDKEFITLNERALKLSEGIDDIEKMYDYLSSRLELENSVLNLLKTQKTFILQGWIPSDKEEFIMNSMSKNFSDCYIAFEEPSEDDMPPVLLKNNKIAEPFEVITSMYALPLPTEVDPTPVLTPFFLLFFGMMMADIGYGILMLLVGLFMLKKMDLEEEGKKIVKLLVYCGIPTIAFGVLYGSFFGGIIPLKPIWLNPVDKPMDVLVVSIALGIVHLYVGLGVKAYSLIKAGKALDAFMDVFSWYIFLSGLIWMLLGSLVGVGGVGIAKIMAIAGALIILFTQGRENESIVGKFFGGLYSLYGVTSYLGDALSYSRLLALGLASGLIGWSFNLLIGLLGKGALALIFGPIIFVAGHTFNFLIGALGTFVHTCRLQYLEFFGKFYEGGGRAFNPLKINTKFIRVNTER